MLTRPEPTTTPLPEPERVVTEQTTAAVVEPEPDEEPETEARPETEMDVRSMMTRPRMRVRRSMERTMATMEPPSMSTMDWVDWESQ